MNTLHPTATDECDTGLHAFVDGRCRDCGSLELRPPALKPGGDLKLFVVEVECGPSTRFLANDDAIAAHLGTLAAAVFKRWSAGECPAVHVVIILPGVAEPAASAPLVGVGACAPTNAATDPATTGNHFTGCNGGCV